jgi:hypothetical protein
MICVLAAVPGVSDGFRYREHSRYARAESARKAAIAR